jgi:N-acetylneuraminic acid mutarotase
VAVLAGGHVVVLGGLGPGDVTTGRVVTVNPRGWAGRATGRLREPAHDASGASLAGRAVVFGGGSTGELADVQVWASGVTHVVGQLPAPRSDSSTTVIGHTAYVLGGFDGASMTRSVLATTDGRRFRVVSHLRQGVRYAAVASYRGAIYVFGGQRATTEGTSSGPQGRLVQRVDPRTGRTRVLGKLPWGIGHAMAFTLGGRLYLAGGRRGTKATSRIWRVDPATAQLTRAGRLPRPISDSAVVQVGKSVALIGGETTGPFAPRRSIVVVRGG